MHPVQTTGGVGKIFLTPISGSIHCCGVIGCYQQFTAVTLEAVKFYIRAVDRVMSSF